MALELECNFKCHRNLQIEVSQGAGAFIVSMNGLGCKGEKLQAYKNAYKDNHTDFCVSDMANC